MQMLNACAWFLWLYIILMEAASQVAAYISKLDLWSNQMDHSILENSLNKHKM